MTFEQYVIEHYGKSIYQIELEVALEYYKTHANRLPFAEHECWSVASIFVKAMKDHWTKNQPKHQVT